MLRRLPIILGIAWLSGCSSINTSQVPMAATYPYSEQRKMQAAHHWQVLAEHEARQMLRSPSLAGRTLFVVGGLEETPFSRSFDSLLTSQLVSRGALVRTDPFGAAHVSYRVQLIEHEDRGYIRAPRGTWTALASGIAVATIPFNHWSEPALALIPGAALVDAFSGNWTSLSDEEIIITTQVTENNRILYSSSNIYYINADDSEHYGDGPGSLRTIPVTDQW